MLLTRHPLRPVWMISLISALLFIQSSTRSQEATGELDFTVVVIDELTIRPVPLTDFSIEEEFSAHAQKILRTDEHGFFTIKLAPGKYTVSSVHPLNFKGRSLSWKSAFSIDAGKVYQLKLTDMDAIAGDAPQTGAHQVTEEGKIYQRLKRGVVTVETDIGSGSGFVVNKCGLILTNQHVTNGTHWAAVRFDRGIRLNANVVLEDKNADVAVLVFNPAGYKDFTVVPLADVTSGPVAVEGERVLAIGSPLHQEHILTTGVISKVEKDVLISDVNINHGNSGGPLLNLNGEAIGITTFGDDPDPGAGGPGISGIIAIQKALPVLERARQKFGPDLLPSSELLPDISDTPIPASAFTDTSKKEPKLILIKAPHHFDTIIFTPFVDAYQDALAEKEAQKIVNRRVQKRSKKGEKEGYARHGHPFWARYAVKGNDPVVTILIKPVLREKAASIWAGVFGALAHVHTRAELEFRDDFYDMQLYRSNTLVQPVRRGRVLAKELYADWDIEVKDMAYGGVYMYDPSVFEPGQPLVLKVRKSFNLEKWDVVKIDPKEQKQIWDEFAPYRDALATSRAGVSASN